MKYGINEPNIIPIVNRNTVLLKTFSFLRSNESEIRIKNNTKKIIFSRVK
jgi:hypothetical protein